MTKSIRKRTFFSFTATILAVTLAFSSFLYVYFNGTLAERVKTDQLYATKQTANNIDAVLISVKQVSYFLCCNESLAENLVKKHGFSKESAINLGLLFSLNTGSLTSPLMQSAYAALLIDPQFPLASAISGDPLSLSNISRQRLYRAADVTDAAWYQNTIARNGQIYTFVTPENQRDIFFAHLLRNIYIADPRYSDTVGVVLYAMPSTRILCILENAKVTQGTIALFLYGNAVLSSTNPTLFPVSDTLSEENRPLETLQDCGTTVKISLAGGTYAASSTMLYGDWKVVLLIPTTELNQHLWDLLPVFFVFIVALLVLGLVLSGLFSKRLTRPILKLSGVMANAQDSQRLPLPAPMPSSQDEIALLYKSYNSMVERIRALTEQAAAEEEEKRTAELRALQAQINPHFIYNTLDSVACIALLSGEDDIVTMVTSLIDLLKYSIQFSRATVTLREEITYLQRYIQIQQLRYTDGFTFLCEVPDQYNDVSISQIILQPLVENSLFHAVSPKGKLAIRLYCEEEGELLHIHVTDNGSSANAQELNRILQSAHEGERYGIGIRNVDKRIRLHMGEQYGLRYESLSSGGLDAIVTIPLHFD